MTSATVSIRVHCPHRRALFERFVIGGKYCTPGVVSYLPCCWHRCRNWHWNITLSYCRGDRRRRVFSIIFPSLSIDIVLPSAVSVCLTNLNHSFLLLSMRNRGNGWGYLLLPSMGTRMTHLVRVYNMNIFFFPGIPSYTVCINLHVSSSFAVRIY